MVVCINNVNVDEHFKPGHKYIVYDFVEHGGNRMVGVYGIDGLLFKADRFEHAVPVAVSPPSPVAKQDVYAYLVDQIEIYASDPPDSEADSGYLECLRDTMEYVFGLVPVTSVSFVAKGAPHG